MLHDHRQFIMGHVRGFPPLKELPDTHPRSQVALKAHARIHAMDYITSLSNPGRDLVCVELFSGKQALVTSFRFLS